MFINSKKLLEMFTTVTAALADSQREAARQHAESMRALNLTTAAALTEVTRAARSCVAAVLAANTSTAGIRQAAVSLGLSELPTGPMTTDFADLPEIERPATPADDPSDDADDFDGMFQQSSNVPLLGSCPGSGA